MLALVAEIFRNRRRPVGAVQAAQRGIIRRRGHHHAARLGGAQMVLDKLPDLAAALADHADDHDIRSRMPRHHAQQSRFADAAAREQADAHAPAHRGQRVDRTHPDIEHLINPGARHRVDRLAQQRPGLRDIRRRQAIQRQAPRIDNPAQQPRPHQRCRRPALDVNPRPAHDPARALLGHHQQPALFEPDHLRIQLRAALSLDQTPRPNRRANPAGMQNLAIRTHNPPIPAHRIHPQRATHTLLRHRPDRLGLDHGPGVREWVSKQGQGRCPWTPRRAAPFDPR